MTEHLLNIALIGVHSEMSISILKKETRFALNFYNNVELFFKEKLIAPIILLKARSDFVDTKQDLLELKKRYPCSQVLIVLDKEEDLDASDYISRGAFWCFGPVLEVETFVNLIQKAYIIFELEKSNEYLQKALQSQHSRELIAQSKTMLSCISQIETIKNFDTPILLYGETGTGKSMFAKYIHDTSERCKKPFVSLSSAALPHDLLEAELFGFEKGAFTGANQSKRGAFEIAEGGTLFLDEIGELPISTQAKLLKVLQDYEVRRLGAESSRKVNVRIITATNKDLEELCQKKMFREDLFFRLDVLRVELPSLIERKEDIPFLAERILAKISEARRKPQVALSPKSLKLLENYSWPGNIRELENVLERASAFANDNVIEQKDIRFSRLASKETDIVTDVNLAGFSFKELEAKAIEDTLLHCGGNKNMAAEILGVSLKTLYNKLNSLEN